MLRHLNPVLILLTSHEQEWLCQIYVLVDIYVLYALFVDFVKFLIVNWILIHYFFDVLLVAFVWWCSILAKTLLLLLNEALVLNLSSLALIGIMLCNRCSLTICQIFII